MTPGAELLAWLSVAWIFVVAGAFALMLWLTARAARRARERKDMEARVNARVRNLIRRPQERESPQGEVNTRQEGPAGSSGIGRSLATGRAADSATPFGRRPPRGPR